MVPLIRSSTTVLPFLRGFEPERSRFRGVGQPPLPAAAIVLEGFALWPGLPSAALRVPRAYTRTNRPAPGRGVPWPFACRDPTARFDDTGPHPNPVRPSAVPFRIALMAASVDRSRSVSSIRKMNAPPCRRANNQLNKAVRRPPMWRYPVGLGANRTLTSLMLFFLSKCARPLPLYFCRVGG